MILIADSGSTKSDWCLINDSGETKVIQTKGLNPYFLSTLEISKELSLNLMPVLGNAEIDELFFYGAGCTAARSESVREALMHHFDASILVASDMLGAARALCQDKPGIACILGTGANSCRYDGERITDNVSPLGYILGDEGGGAVIGRNFIGALLKDQCSSGLKELFLERYNLTSNDIIERVYRQPNPNRFLASFAPFIKEHISDPTVRAIVLDAFKRFVQYNLLQYAGVKELPIHFVGSIAYHFQDTLEEAVTFFGLRLGRILQAPIEGLIEYHAVK